MTVNQRPSIQPQAVHFHESFGPRRRRPARYLAQAERDGWLMPVMGALLLTGLIVGGLLVLALVSLGLYILVALGGEIFGILKEAWPHG